MKNSIIDNKFKIILIFYIIISIFITLVLDLIKEFSAIDILISLVYGIIGGYLWYIIIGKYVLINGDDLALRSYIILISPIIVFFIIAFIYGIIPISREEYILTIFFGMGFLALCYYRLNQLGYGIFSGSKKLFSKDNLGFIIILGGYIFLILLSIYVFVILGLG